METARKILEPIGDVLTTDLGVLPVWAWAICAALGYSALRTVLYAFRVYGRNIGWIVLASQGVVGTSLAALMAYMKTNFGS